MAFEGDGGSVRGGGAPRSRGIQGEIEGDPRNERGGEVISSRGPPSWRRGTLESLHHFGAELLHERVTELRAGAKLLPEWVTRLRAGARVARRFESAFAHHRRVSALSVSVSPVGRRRHQMGGRGACGTRGEARDGREVAVPPDRTRSPPRAL